MSFENVHFRYTEDGPWVLRGISFTVRKGDRVAIVGATGSGKSTIVRILTRTYTRYQGSIKINGVELSLISRDFLLRLISLMQQESYLFEESIAFQAACDLVFKGLDQPSGYTAPILHERRLQTKRALRALCFYF